MRRMTELLHCWYPPSSCWWLSCVWGGRDEACLFIRCTLYLILLHRVSWGKRAASCNTALQKSPPSFSWGNLILQLSDNHLITIIILSKGAEQEDWQCSPGRLHLPAGTELGCRAEAAGYSSWIKGRDKVFWGKSTVDIAWTAQIRLWGRFQLTLISSCVLICMFVWVNNIKTTEYWAVYPAGALQ